VQRRNDIANYYENDSLTKLADIDTGKCNENGPAKIFAPPAKKIKNVKPQRD
jgi:hypothetical protein